jgi:hypothetical protein
MIPVREFRIINTPADKNAFVEKPSSKIIKIISKIAVEAMMISKKDK